MQLAHYHVYKDAKSEWRWRFVAKNSKIIAVSSESYHHLTDCEHSIKLVRQGATAPVRGDEHFTQLRKQRQLNP
ncbi:DUF1508 domain-containing protein [Pseudomonas nitroreducens]|uniref:DUF1508 domain-containing protein n=1 Tax=Pseudomonas nitroreducens TaxID=46680 RepID=A0A5R9A1D5_PSENT|nr:DUF1508 domain-containing protein [Pseudomonas nitroreducens]TLP72488.1 DUF1508 domain-containing protein [Pseudomonas nitroreducens]